MIPFCNKQDKWNGFLLYYIILTLHLLLVVVASNSSSSLHHFNSISGSAVFFGKLHERLCYDKSDAPQVVRLSRHFKRLTHGNTLERPAICKLCAVKSCFRISIFRRWNGQKRSVFENFLYQETDNKSDHKCDHCVHRNKNFTKNEFFDCLISRSAKKFLNIVPKNS